MFQSRTHTCGELRLANAGQDDAISAIFMGLSAKGAGKPIRE